MSAPRNKWLQILGLEPVPHSHSTFSKENLSLKDKFNALPDEFCASIVCAELGVPRVTAARTISKMKDKGWIEYVGRRNVLAFYRKRVTMV